MASFFSFLINKRIPSPSTLRALLRGPLTTYRAFVYGFFASVVAIIFLIIVTVHNGFLVTVPARGGSLTEGIIGAPRAINPVLATIDTDKSLSALVYAGLMKTLADGTIVNELAQDYTVSPDGLTYTFTLKKTTFHDGKNLTSNDIAFTVSKLQNSFLNPSHASYWSVVGVETPDEHTVIFTLPAPRNDFLERATIGILPEHIWGDISDEEFLTTKKNIKGIGAGAFAVKSVSKNDGVVESLTLKRNPRYILGTPLLKTIHVTIFNNQKELMGAVLDSDIDLTSQLLPETIIAPLPKQFSIKQSPTSIEATLYHLRGNGGSLANAGLVTVLSQFIDKKGIIAIVENGYGEVLDSSTTALAVEEAQAKLATLGYQLRNGTLTRGGSPVGISIATTNDTDLVALANTLAQELRKLGITVSIRNFDPGFFQIELENTTFSTVLLKGIEPPTSYEAVLPLYKTTIPFVVKTKAQRIIPSILISPVLRYANVNEWFLNTDKLYPLLAKNKSQTTN